MASNGPVRFARTRYFKQASCEPDDPPDERLFGARLTPGTGIGKPEPRRERPNVPEAGSIGTLRAGNSNLVLAKTHLSLGFRWNSCRRPVHAGAGSGGGRSSAISRRISAKSLLVTATSAIWKATCNRELRRNGLKG